VAAADAPPRTLLRDGAIALVGLALVVTPWMGRNLQQFGTFGISDRGGLAIWFRVTWNDASPEELRGAWVYFAPPLQPAGWGARSASTSTTSSVTVRSGAWLVSPRRMKRSGGSFYRIARGDRGELTDAYLAQGLPQWRPRTLPTATS
jgi:hypothetical protein